jgi:hypothetical protein
VLLVGADRAGPGDFGDVGQGSGGQFLAVGQAGSVIGDARGYQETVMLAPVSAVPLLNRLLADVPPSSGLVYPRLVPEEGGPRRRRR